MQDATSLKTFFHSEKPLLLIVGKRGSDKTKLLSQAITYCDPAHMMLRLKGQMQLRPIALTELFRKHWAVTVTDHNKLNESLEEIISCLNAKRQTCLLLIDNAHLLSIAMLAALCHLSHQQEKKRIAIRIILAGQAELISKTNALYLKKFTRPPMIRLPDPAPVISLPRFSLLSFPKKFFHVIAKTHPIKIMTVAGLIFTGFFGWKMQNSTLIHWAFSQHHAVKQIIQKNDHAKT